MKGKVIDNLRLGRTAAASSAAPRRNRRKAQAHRRLQLIALQQQLCSLERAQLHILCKARLSRSTGLFIYNKPHGAGARLGNQHTFTAEKLIISWCSGDLS